MINISRLINSFRYAFAGLRYALKTDQNLLVHFVVAGLVLIFSFLFEVNSFELGILMVMIILVITAEMVNTAIEKVVDLITEERRENAKIAKDISSAMVLVAVIGAVIAGLVIFLPYILRLF